MSVYNCRTKNFVYATQGYIVREIASLTKIMTLIIVCHQIANENLDANSVIRISKQAASQLGTSAYLKPGD